MNQSRSHSEIEIRHCATLGEYDECVRLEHVIWGEDIAVPSAIFVVAHHTGGQVLGAFDAIPSGASGEPKMVGFTLALAAVRAGKPYLHSHMTAVLPEFHNRGVGRRLKLFQRQDALKRGIDLIEWTFDPLDLKNAHFNFVRLGAVARTYIPDCYGVTESPLHAGLPTDRLVAQWWLNSERVKSILADDVRPMNNSAERISLPTNIAETRNSDRQAAARLQTAAREQFQEWFAKGYAATGVESRAGATDYLLEPAAAIAGVRLPELVAG
jgi:predicted GNAT superfamily acetyltransferase